MSWNHTDDGYRLFCNRDEKKTRRPASAPRVLERLGVRYLAPSDGDHGGTWIAVNEHAVAACLLNGHGRARGALSRGLVIPELIWARSVDDCAFLLRHLDLAPFAPFTLLLLEPSAPALIADWDAARLVIDSDAGQRRPLTSSSYDPEGVRRARIDEFARHSGDLRRFHATHGEGPSAYSPCMHRADAETVSFTEAVVSRDGIRVGYLPCAPCAGGEFLWANLS